MEKKNGGQVDLVGFFVDAVHCSLVMALKHESMYVHDESVIISSIEV